MIFGSKLLSSFLMSGIYFFVKYLYARYRHRQGAVTLKIYNSSLDRLGAIILLTLRHPCLGFDPHFENHWARSTK